MAKKQPYVVQVLVTDAEDILAVYTLSEVKKEGGTNVDSLINPNINAKMLSELMGILSQHTEQAYYTSRVKSLSREARDEIKKALDAEDIDVAPF